MIGVEDGLSRGSQMTKQSIVELSSGDVQLPFLPQHHVLYASLSRSSPSPIIGKHRTRAARNLVAEHKAASGCSQECGLGFKSNALPSKTLDPSMIGMDQP